MKKKAILYPFCEEVLPAVRVFDGLQDCYEISGLVAPSGFGCVGMDAGYSCNHPEIGREVLGELPSEEDWDTLLLFEPRQQTEELYLEKYLEEAVSRRKEVVFLCTEENGIPEKIKKTVVACPGQVRVKACLSLPEEEGWQPQVHEPEIPVVLVGGLLQEADCGAVFTALAERFHRDGKRVAAFSGHPVGGLFGFYSLEHIWRNSELTEDDKVRKINLYINGMAEKSGAEIILLEAPTALMKYDDKALNGFGIQSYMLCQAAPPDYLIGCVPFDLADARMVSALSEDFSCRFGCGLCAVHVSNILLDFADSQQKQKIETLRANMKFVREKIEKEKESSEIPMFDVIGEGIEGLYKRINGYA